MKAVYIREFGGTENLEIREINEPSKPAGTEVLVRVKAAALNRADLLQRKGFYPAPDGFPERVPGLEFAGEVSAIGENVGDLSIGDRVFGITAGGAQAEYLLTEEFLLAKIPADLDYPAAAAIPEAFITANDAVFSQAQLQPGETLLIHAVGSGVGLAALQLAKANNITTFGTSRTRDKLERCREIGLNHAILTEEGNNFATVIAEKTDGRGVDVILDLVGAGYFRSNLDCLSLKGRLMLVGLVSGRTSEIDLGKILSKRLKIIGTVLRARSAAEKAQATREFIDLVLPLFETGKLNPNVDRVFAAAEVREAHDFLESNVSFGKVVLDFR